MAGIITKPIFLVISSSTGSTVEKRFDDGSLTYLTEAIDQTFNHLTIDNVGSGNIRFSLVDKLTISSAVDGSKTVEDGDSLTIDDVIRYIQIYFIATSQVELILTSD
jgi:hypothetical protein